LFPIVLVIIKSLIPSEDADGSGERK